MIPLIFPKVPQSFRPESLGFPSYPLTPPQEPYNKSLDGKIVSSLWKKVAAVSTAGSVILSTGSLLKVMNTPTKNTPFSGEHHWSGMLPWKQNIHYISKIFILVHEFCYKIRHLPCGPENIMLFTKKKSKLSSWKSSINIYIGTEKRYRKRKRYNPSFTIFFLAEVSIVDLQESSLSRKTLGLLINIL